MEPASLPALRALLMEAGYGLLVRADAWCECFVHRDDERWVGRGITEDDALRDAIDKLLPSHLARLLLDRHGVLQVVVSPTPSPTAAFVAIEMAAASSAIVEATSLPAMAQEAAPSPAPDEAQTTPLRAASSSADDIPAPAPTEAAFAAVTPAIVVEPEAGTEAASPELAAVIATAEPEAPALPAAPAAGPANEVPLVEQQPPPRPTRARTTDALETVERLLSTIEGRLGALARMCADRQRLHMLVWICRARAVEESLPGVREVEHAVARVARRLTEIGKMFWPGSVRALQLSARPADVRREMHATWAVEPSNWTEATQLSERLLEDHLDRSAEISLDEDGWADGAARLPKPADPDALFEEVDAELKAMLIPPGEVPNGRLGELGPIEFEALLNAARKLRWLRGAVRDDLAWGISMGRLRRAVPGLGERAGRVRDALDHRAKPPASWAKVLQTKRLANKIAVTRY